MTESCTGGCACPDAPYFTLGASVCDGIEDNGGEFLTCEMLCETTTTTAQPGACCYYDFTYVCVVSSEASCNSRSGKISWTSGAACSEISCPPTTTAAPTTTTAAPTTTTADYCTSNYSSLACEKCLGLGRSQNGGCYNMNVIYDGLCTGTWSGHGSYNINPCRPAGSTKSEFPP